MGAAPKLVASGRRLVRAKSPVWLWDQDGSTANSFTCQEQNAREGTPKHLEKLVGFSGKMCLSVWPSWRAAGAAAVYLQLQAEVVTH